MSKSQRKPSGKLPPFVPTLKEMIRSQAYRKLSNSARVAYLLLCNQRIPWTKPEVIYPYSQAKVYMCRDSWSAAIKQLVEYGFIEIRQQGGLYRVTNIYHFVDGWRSH